MFARLPAFVLGFHGCDRAVGEAILAGQAELQASTNAYDWLGSGIYFWENNPERALNYATMLAGLRRRSASNIRDPFVIGAVIDLGHCLNLLDHSALVLLNEQYALLAAACAETGTRLPENRPLRGSEDLILRNLDRAVIESLHGRHREEGKPAYDTVRGVFFEGPELYPNAGFRAKNHIQICVRTSASVLGYFRYPRLTPKG